MKGFSIIELLVVIAIIAILGGVSVPTYLSYTIRTNIVAAMQITDRVMYDAVTQYEVTGSFLPNSVVVGGTTVPYCSWTYINYQGIAWFSYCLSGPGIEYSVTLNGLEGMPGYVTPTSLNVFGAHSSYTKAAAVDSSGKVTYGCGVITPGSLDMSQAILFAYLPSSCQCTNVSAFTGGTCQ